MIPKYLLKFDSSIKVNEHEIGDVDCEIKIDFRLLVPNSKRGETELLLTFIEVGQKRVLKHPLCETFLFLKWHRIRKFFLFSLFYHAVFVMLFSMLIIGVYEKECPADKEQLEMRLGDDVLGVNRNCVTPTFVQPLGYLVIFMNLLLLAKEFFQMAHGYSIYVKCWENWIQCLIILGVFLCAVNFVFRFYCALFGHENSEISENNLFHSFLYLVAEHIVIRRFEACSRLAVPRSSDRNILCVA